MSLSRRRFLAAAGLAVVGGAGGFAYYRGLRFPPPLLVGSGPVTRAEAGGVSVQAEGAAFQGMEDGTFRFRAFVPEPAFELRSHAGTATVVVENLHAGASLEPGREGLSIDETTRNLTRTVVAAASADGTGFSWRFPKREAYRFAAIGDTGGGTELRWVLDRAAALGADFLLHLGDIYYEKGDFNRAAVNLNTAGLPTYAAIGNHDFFDHWQVLYPEFHRVVGPGNWLFTLGGIEFVNIDTAAEMLPADRGPRLEVLDRMGRLDPAGPIRDRVVITHSPLRDPDPDRDHVVSRVGEMRWLHERLVSRGTRNLLAGHIHIKEEFDDQGLYTWITGQGLAHADLIVNRPYAEILLGDVEPGEPARYQWQPLEMPFEMHCNERNLGVLDALERPDVKARLLEQCNKT